MLFNFKTIFQKQIFKFLIVGTLTVLIDYIFYYLFLFFLSTTFAKGISFIIGAVFAFIANKIYTFNYNQFSKKSIIFFVLLYLLSLFVNIAVNDFCLLILTNSILKIEISFIISTSVSALINYLGMKYFVFKNNHFEI